MNHSYIKQDRQCGDCTACCDGWLSGNAHGHEFFPGQPCFYLCKSGCSIYENRPIDPCRGYSCMWLKDPDFFPEWMKPTESNLICTERDWVDCEGNPQFYFEFVTMGKEITLKSYHWIMKMHYQHKIPIVIEVFKELCIFGPDDFIDYINRT